MINKDSIVTAYDEHLTLVEWLQKVENALNNAVLTNLGIAKLSDKDNVATYQVTATFADNSTIASDSFTLPSTDIVTAFDNLATLVKGFDTRIAANRQNVNYILDIIDIAGEKIKADVLKNSINGDDDVIVEIDNDEDNEKLGIHLSPELQAKLARVLLKPSSAPTTRKVVTIDTNGAQDNVDGTELTTLMSNIVDSHGNKRFVEGDISMLNISGIRQTYGKWSLSGTHLMIVIAFDIDSGVTTPVNSVIAVISLPGFIYSKIKNLWNADNVVSLTDVMVRGKTIWFNSKKLNDIRLQKPDSQSRLWISTSANTITTTELSACRIQYDLLIDSE